MKKILISIALAIPFIAFTGCDKGFEEINKDPVNLTSINPEYLLTSAQRNSVSTRLNYEASIVQQVITVQPGTLQGANFNVDWDPGQSSLWESYYTNSLKYCFAIIDATKDKPESINIYNMARIWKAYCFMVLVSSYGDIPYSDAGLGYLKSIYLPKYDDASVIWDDILKELKEAVAALDASKPTATNELFYKGNIPKWKKLGNSILLRAAMRLTKVNPTKAKEYVGYALDPANGGVIEAVADNAGIAATTTYYNPMTGGFHGSERGNYYLAEPFVTYLKNTNDPRLKEIAVRYQFPANLLGQTGTENTDPAQQIGMPFGYNGGNIVTAPGFPGIIGAGFAYSQPNRRTIAAQLSTCQLVTASQTLLLKAEAAFRGYITGDAAALYNAGVKAHMAEFTQSISTCVIPVASQDAYLVANPYDPAKALEQINTQYWISSYLNFSEAWANFRRSDFPALVPNPYPGADPSVKGAFIRRFTYPDREYSVNPTNLNAALSHQGTDLMSTRVFWDKP